MKYLLSLFSLFVLPILALAQTTAAPIDNNIGDIIDIVGDWVTALIPILIALGLLFFLWNLVKFMFAGADEEKRKESRGMMVYGIIFLFVMVSVWGLVGFLGDILGIDAVAQPPIVPVAPGSI